MGASKFGGATARAVQWHVANLEYGCATALRNVSLQWWDQDDQHGMAGDHVVITSGYDKLIDGLAEGTEVLLQREVSRIEHGPDGVRVHTKAGGDGLAADAVLVTVPLGVLKANSPRFVPPLPEWKRAAVERLGFGPIEKVVLLFSRPFWEEYEETAAAPVSAAAAAPDDAADGGGPRPLRSADFFGIMLPEDAAPPSYEGARGEFFVFWNLHRSHGLPALLCISSGVFASQTWRSLSYKGVVASALGVLGRTFGEAPRQTFRKSVVSDWGKNPFARGSYSYVAVGSSGRDYDELARPVGARLFFAGEHTNGQHPATATGAFLSGLREAQRIDAACASGFNFAPAPNE